MKACVNHTRSVLKQNNLNNAKKKIMPNLLMIPVPVLALLVSVMIKIDVEFVCRIC